MRSKKISISIFVISCVTLVSLYSETVFANNLQQSRNIVGTNISSVSESQDIYFEKEPKISADISEEELNQGYEAFLKFVNDNNLSVTFDYKEFKQQYYVLGYDGIDDYLEALYEVFDLNSEEKDNEQQTIKEPTFTNDPNDYRAGLTYSDEILDAYEDYTTTLNENGIFVEMSLESFAEEYEKSLCDNISVYCSELKASCIKSQTFSNSAEISSLYSTGSSSKYYYNIGCGLGNTTSIDEKPNYDRYNILELAQPGDIILDKKGSFGVAGHVAIVEGKYYSNQYSCYYIRVIESIDIGVRRGLWDAVRIDERNTYLYQVYTATPDQKKEAIEFCIGQLGKLWTVDFSHDSSPNQLAWMCSQLVWAAYINQKVDIEMNGYGGGDPGVTPYDITVNSSMVTHVDFREDLHTIEDGTYYITNYNSGCRLDIRGRTPNNSIQIQQYTAGALPEQKWQLKYNSNEKYYTIKSDITDNGSFYLDVASPINGAHAKVKLWNHYSNPEERWFIQKDTNNTYRFINGYSGLCMDIFGGSKNSGADVQVYPYTGTDDQKWMLSRCGTQIFENGVYYITNYRSNLRLDIRGGTPGNSIQIQQYSAGNYPKQKWKLEWNPVWSCYYVKSNITSNGTFYLDVASPSSGSHAKVKLWNTCINPEERWTILSNGDGTYRFINGYDGLCMDIANGSTQAGADVQVYPYEGTTDQKWKLQKTS